MKRLSALVISALILATTYAHAVVVQTTNAGFTGTTFIQGQINGFEQPGLTGLLILQFDGVTNNGLTWNFDYTVVNNNVSPLTYRISAFGFNIPTPGLISGTATGEFDTVQLNIPFGPQVFVADNGVTKGNSASGEFTLTFATVMSYILIDGAHFRFQDIVGSNYGVYGLGVNHNVALNPLTPVPLPGAALLFISGLVGLGLLNRRRRLTGV